MRDVLNESAPRRIAVLDPLKLVIDNYPEGQSEDCFAPNHPQQPELGKRAVPFSSELWIEREDFMEMPTKGYFRLFPGNKVRLRYGYVVECTGCDKDANGNVIAVHCNYLPDTKSGTPGADTRQGQGQHPLGVRARTPTPPKCASTTACSRPPSPGAGEPAISSTTSTRTRSASSAPSSSRRCGTPQPKTRFQFERHGYFVADRVDSQPGAPVFNRAVTLKDSWVKAGN